MTLKLNHLHLKTRDPAKTAMLHALVVNIGQSDRPQRLVRSSQ